MTLIERSFWETLPDPHSSADKVWGVAYRIEAEHVEEVKEYLDIREINGYTIVSQALESARISVSSPPRPSLGERRKFMYPPGSASLRGLRMSRVTSFSLFGLPLVALPSDRFPSSVSGHVPFACLPPHDFECPCSGTTDSSSE